jgi:hypothetical protein
MNIENVYQNRSDFINKLYNENFLYLVTHSLQLSIKMKHNERIKKHNYNK